MEPEGGQGITQYAGGGATNPRARKEQGTTRLEGGGYFGGPWSRRRKKRKGIPEKERTRGLREQVPLEGVFPEEPNIAFQNQEELQRGWVAQKSSACLSPQVLSPVLQKQTGKKNIFLRLAWNRSSPAAVSLELRGSFQPPTHRALSL